MPAASNREVEKAQLLRMRPHGFVQLRLDLVLPPAQLAIQGVPQPIAQLFGRVSVDPADALEIDIRKRQFHAQHFWLDHQVPQKLSRHHR